MKDAGLHRTSRASRAVDAPIAAFAVPVRRGWGLCIRLGGESYHLGAHSPLPTNSFCGVRDDHLCSCALQQEAIGESPDLGKAPMISDLRRAATAHLSPLPPVRPDCRHCEVPRPPNRPRPGARGRRSFMKTAVAVALLKAGHGAHYEDTGMAT
jgi:hypothetical protein